MQLPSKTHLLLVPSYNSGSIVVTVVKEALKIWQPVCVVVDGSEDGSGDMLENLAACEAHLTVLRHTDNRGKGSAIFTGIKTAAQRGYTHILTMDADGQHSAASVKKFMSASMAQPEALVLGMPIFDESAPALRVKGRKISNFWANLETLWMGIQDSLFGFRVYPIAPLLATMESCCFARGFDFDPEVVVRLVWQGLPVINIPAPVRYLAPQQGGSSHFHYLRDNTVLTWMHIRLMIGFVWRLPVLVWRQFLGRPLRL